MCWGGGVLGNALFAKEPTNWIFGVGVGAGKSQIEQKWSDSSRNKLQGLNVAWTNFAVMTDASEQDWGVAYEFLVGYKHWFNKWAGFRYYANVGAQHYKHTIFDSGNVKATIIDYTLNADLLIDFWESELFAVGVLGGIGFGGTSFEKKAIAQYMAVYDAQSSRPIGLANVQKHYFNVNANVGFRVAFFQKVRRVKERVCEDNYVDGKRLCRVPVYYIGHNIEFNAKFPLLDYQATPYADIIVLSQETQNNIASRPGYKVTNPYRLTIRYVVDF